MGRRAVALGAGVAVALAVGGIGFVALRSAPAPDVPASKHLAFVDGPSSTASAPTGARNVVVVLACTLRKDQTTVYAPRLSTTPFLAELAAQGVVLDDLVAAAPWTKAASTAILTGHHAAGVAMVEPGPRRNEQVLPDAVPTLAERFSGAGYRTLGVTANPNLHASYGFGRGFEAYGQPTTDWYGAGGIKISGRTIAETVLSRLDEADSRPLYLQVMFVDAHSPFDAPAPDADRSVPEQVQAYRASLRTLDAAIERLVEGLDERGLLRDAVLLVANDHGEGLGFPAHHGKSHGRYLAPSTVGGVGVFVAPGLPAGRRVSGVASQIDLAPTLWHLAGLDARDGWEGIDLSAALVGDQEGTGRTEAYADTWYRAVHRTARYTDRRACQRADAEDEVTDPRGVSFQPGCFDRTLDPHHSSPFDDPEGMAAIAAWRQDQAARGARYRSIRADPDRDRDDQLEALGYRD